MELNKITFVYNCGCSREDTTLGSTRTVNYYDDCSKCKEQAKMKRKPVSYDRDYIDPKSNIGRLLKWNG